MCVVIEKLLIIRRQSKLCDFLPNADALGGDPFGGGVFGDQKEADIAPVVRAAALALLGNIVVYRCAPYLVPHLFPAYFKRCNGMVWMAVVSAMAYDDSPIVMSVGYAIADALVDRVHLDGAILGAREFERVRGKEDRLAQLSEICGVEFGNLEAAQGGDVARTPLTRFEALWVETVGAFPYSTFSGADYVFCGKSRDEGGTDGQGDAVAPQEWTSRRLVGSFLSEGIDDAENPGISGLGRASGDAARKALLNPCPVLGGAVMLPRPRPLLTLPSAMVPRSGAAASVRNSKVYEDLGVFANPCKIQHLLANKLVTGWGADDDDGDGSGESFIDTPGLQGSSARDRCQATGPATASSGLSLAGRLAAFPLEAHALWLCSLMVDMRAWIVSRATVMLSRCGVMGSVSIGGMCLSALVRIMGTGLPFVHRLPSASYESITGPDREFSWALMARSDVADCVDWHGVACVASGILNGGGRGEVASSHTMLQLSTIIAMALRLHPASGHVSIASFQPMMGIPVDSVTIDGDLELKGVSVQRTAPSPSETVSPEVLHVRGDPWVSVTMDGEGSGSAFRMSPGNGLEACVMSTILNVLAAPLEMNVNAVRTPVSIACQTVNAAVLFPVATPEVHGHGVVPEPSGTRGASAVKVEEVLAAEFWSGPDPYRPGTVCHTAVDPFTGLPCFRGYSLTELLTSLNIPLPVLSSFFCQGLAVGDGGAEVVFGDLRILGRQLSADRNASCGMHLHRVPLYMSLAMLSLDEACAVECGALPERSGGVGRMPYGILSDAIARKHWQSSVVTSVSAYSTTFDKAWALWMLMGVLSVAPLCGLTAGHVAQVAGRDASGCGGEGDVLLRVPHSGWPVTVFNEAAVHIGVLPGPVSLRRALCRRLWAVAFARECHQRVVSAGAGLLGLGEGVELVDPPVQGKDHVMGMLTGHLLARDPAAWATAAAASTLGARFIRDDVCMGMDLALPLTASPAIERLREGVKGGEASRGGTLGRREPRGSGESSGDDSTFSAYVIQAAAPVMNVLPPATDAVMSAPLPAAVGSEVNAVLQSVCKVFPHTSQAPPAMTVSQLLAGKAGGAAVSVSTIEEQLDGIAGAAVRVSPNSVPKVSSSPVSNRSRGGAGLDAQRRDLGGDGWAEQGLNESLELQHEVEVKYAASQPDPLPSVSECLAVTMLAHDLRGFGAADGTGGKSSIFGGQGDGMGGTHGGAGVGSAVGASGRDPSSLRDHGTHGLDPKRKVEVVTSRTLEHLSAGGPGHGHMLAMECMGMWKVGLLVNSELTKRSVLTTDVPRFNRVGREPGASKISQIYVTYGRLLPVYFQLILGSSMGPVIFPLAFLKSNCENEELIGRCFDVEEVLMDQRVTLKDGGTITSTGGQQAARGMGTGPVGPSLAASQHDVVSSKALSELKQRSVAEYDRVRLVQRLRAMQLSGRWGLVDLAAARSLHVALSVDLLTLFDVWHTRVCVSGDAVDENGLLVASVGPSLERVIGALGGVHPVGVSLVPALSSTPKWCRPVSVLGSYAQLTTTKVVPLITLGARVSMTAIFVEGVRTPRVPVLSHTVSAGQFCSDVLGSLCDEVILSSRQLGQDINILSPDDWMLLVGFALNDFSSVVNRPVVAAVPQATVKKCSVDVAGSSMLGGDSMAGVPSMVDRAVASASQFVAQIWKRITLCCVYIRVLNRLKDVLAVPLPTAPPDGATGTSLVCIGQSQWCSYSVAVCCENQLYLAGLPVAWVWHADAGFEDSGGCAVGAAGLRSVTQIPLREDRRRPSGHDDGSAGSSQSSRSTLTTILELVSGDCGYADGSDGDEQRSLFSARLEHVIQEHVHIAGGFDTVLPMFLSVSFPLLGGSVCGGVSWSEPRRCAREAWDERWCHYAECATRVSGASLRYEHGGDQRPVEDTLQSGNDRWGPLYDYVY